MSWLADSTPTVAIETEGVRFSKIYCGDSHTYAIDADGNIWGCGDNEFSRVGDGKNVTSGVLKQITQDLIFLQVSPGWPCAFALDEYGDFWWWGKGNSEVVWKLPCVHFEENPIHYEHICEGLVMNIPTESTIETTKSMLFYDSIFKVYIITPKGELFGWQTKTVKPFINKEDAKYAIGNGTWEFHGIDNPAQIFKEVS
jgi:hypothetical protein